MVLTRSQIKSADRLYIENSGISEYELVRAAAESAYGVLAKHVDGLANKKVLVLCGTGLNGADGLALARLLKSEGAAVSVCLTASDGMCSVSERLFSECEKAGIGLCEPPFADNYDVVLDAVYGIGFHGALDGKAAELLKAANGLHAFKIAVDVPSGVSADSGDVSDGALKADMTVALCAKKPCHLFYPAKAFCSRVLVAELDFGAEVFARVSPYLFEIKNRDFKALLEKRDCTQHKGFFGRAGLVVGSQKYRGAAVLSVKTALSCGAGLVNAFVPDCIYGAFLSDCISAVITPLKSKNGGICDRSLSAELSECTAVLCGSGIGLSDGAAAAVRSVAETEKPVVFDGDALTHIARDMSLLKRPAYTVLTPHMGEFSRLVGKSIEEIRSNRLSAAISFAREKKCVLVLKDSVTVTALPDGRAFILSKPTSAMSKGGSGDVLAGMICSFLAQGYSPSAAAVISVSLHNACGHLACEELGEYSALPEDFIKMIPRLLK